MKQELVIRIDNHVGNILEGTLLELIPLLQFIQRYTHSSSLFL